MSDNQINESQEILTVEGAEKLQQELDQRIKVTRKEIANKLELATEQGDLSENSAYKSALEEKELNENRIAEIQETLRDAVIQDTSSASTSTVTIGNVVKLKRLSDKQEMEVTIVGKSEADPASLKISIDSPIGKAIYNHRKGEKVLAKLPTEQVEFEILQIK